ncbi:MAG: tRNA 2-thiouridine(34) synthase MnmA [Alphaproteobacteria bacterium]|nr:tRNA 2-thiouridine(34) synthase MnmA [Alphaproteobacteria bacterium]
MKQVAIGLSGGVDSTLTALLLKEQGFNVVGISMSIYNKDIPNLKEAINSCYGPTEKEDYKIIQEWAKNYGIDSVILDCSEEYKQTVLRYFKEAYLSGTTPNPCIKCNAEMKFGLLLDRAKKEGLKFDYFATGHYANIEEKNGRFILKKGKDEKKDQSYFLYRLSQEQLSKTLFPLGNFTKEEVRQMALERNIPVAEKKDSQDFYSGDYKDLLEQQPKTGVIRHINGKILGKHEGFFNYTIGQRKGLGIAHPVPLFVVELDAENNEVIVAPKEATFSKKCKANDVVWGGIEVKENTPLPVMAKYRSAGRAVPATLIRLSDSEIEVVFDEEQSSLTKGKSVVCYQDDCVICGGVIV